MSTQVCEQPRLVGPGLQRSLRRRPSETSTMYYSTASYSLSNPPRASSEGCTHVVAPCEK